MKQVILKFSTPHVSCIHCIESIENHISTHFNQSFGSFELLNYFQYDLAHKTIQLKVNILEESSSEEDIATRLMNIVVLDEIGQEMTFLKNTTSNSHFLGAFLGLLAAIFWITVSTGLFLLAPSLHVLAMVLSVGLLSWMTSSFLKHAFLQAKLGWTDRSKPFFNMDSLFVSTGLIIILSSIFNLFLPWIPNMLEAGFLIFGFRHLGIIFQSYLDKKMGFSRSLVEMFQYRQYHLNEKNQSIYAKDLKIKNRFCIKKGDIIPVDAKLVSCSSDFEIRDMLETGSYQTLNLKKDRIYFAGTECTLGSAIFEVSKILDDCRFALMDQSILSLVQSQKKAPILNRLDDWLQWFIPGIFMVSLTSFVVVSQFFPMATALTCALSVLVSACPCTLGLIVPMALRMGAYKSSAEQIYFQTSEALQKAAKVDILVLDYHGTLTAGDWRLSEFECNSLFSRQQAFEVIYTIERSMQGHSLGKKILDLMATYQVDKVLAGETQDLGYGGKLTTEQGQWWFGNAQILTHLGLQKPEDSGHRLYLFFQEHASSSIMQVGSMDVYDPLKKDAKLFVEQMIARGKDVRICTGADQTTAMLIAKQLEIDLSLVSYNNRMNDKMQYLKNLKQEFPTQTIAMLGDAINDKEALSICDLSIFMTNEYNQNHFNTHLKKSADILVVSDTLMHMAHIFQIAHDTMSVIQQNLYFSMIYNFLSLLLATGVFLAWGFAMPPVLGVILMITQSVLLTFNTYRVLYAHQDYFQDEVSSRQRNALTLT